MPSLEDLGLLRQVLTRRRGTANFSLDQKMLTSCGYLVNLSSAGKIHSFATMIPLPAKVSKIQLDFSNRFSARAEVVVPENIGYVELFDLPGGVHATNLSDVAPGKHEFLLHGDGKPPFKVGDTLSARGFSQDELPD